MISNLVQRVERLVNRQIAGFENGTPLWVPCEKQVWRAGVVISCKEEEVDGVTKRIAVVETKSDKGRIERVNVEVSESEYDSGQPTFYKRDQGLSPESAAGVEDLSSLPMLHEPEILHTVKTRYSGLKIYTFAGPMLLAVNPCQQIPGLYDNAMLQSFADVPRGCPAPMPHIFGTAREAFTGIQHSNMSQTVLVSGESGAGKTESAKFVIRFLALAGGRKVENSEVTMEHRVLESVPLLEALGNARTLKNDNSSRFGKFIELNFQNNADVFGPCIMNAETHTYLLETVRVTELNEGERCFHMFYQILAAAATARSRTAVGEAKAPLLIPSIPGLVFGDIRNWSSRNFAYLARTSFDMLPGVDEAANFNRNIEAMRAFGMTDDEISQVIGAIVAVLYLGNIKFQDLDGNSEASEAVDGDLIAGPLCRAAELLGVDSEDLEQALCSRVLQLYEKSTKQVIQKSRTKAQASNCRDALARHLYSSVFAYVLDRINASLSGKSTKNVARNCSPLPSIGVLDIFGFEVFEHNCFEQLCINYANEVLQQHFNMVVFEHELELYEAEGLDYDKVDLRAAASLQTPIRASGVIPGIFPILDDECTVSGGTSDAWLRKVAEKYGGSSAFELIPLRKGQFKLQHFAGPVDYCADAFLSKNKDTLSPEAMECMQGSSKTVLQQQFKGHGRKFGTSQCTTTGKVLKAKANSVSSDFREQLEKLIKNIQATNAHFVRCVKPNEQLAPKSFDCFSVLTQLKYQGVLEAIRVARAGYATRYNHDQAVRNYWMLMPGLRKKSLGGFMRRGMHQEAAQTLFSSLKTSIPGLPPNGIQVGKTLVFFKTTATDVLGVNVRRKREIAALQIQSRWRTRRLYNLFRMKCRSVVMLQKVERGRKARAGYRYLRGAAVTIQAAHRGMENRRMFKQVVTAVRCMQRFVRPRLVATKQRTRMLYGKDAERWKAPQAVKCRTGHPLQACDRQKAWRCDQCGKSVRAGANEKRWRCDSCDYDMCAPCHDTTMAKLKANTKTLEAVPQAKAAKEEQLTTPVKQQAKEPRFAAQAKFARYLKNVPTSNAPTANVPKSAYSLAAKNKGAIVKAGEVEQVKNQLILAMKEENALEMSKLRDELVGQIREQQETIQSLHAMVNAQQDVKESAVNAAREVSSTQNAHLKEFLSAQLQGMSDRVAGLGSTLVAMDSAVSAAKEHAEHQQLALKQQHANFQVSLQEQFQSMKEEMSHMVRGTETDTARVRGCMLEFEDFVKTKFNALEESFESTQSNVGQEELDKAMQGLRVELDERQKAVDESVAAKVSHLQPKLGSLDSKYEELSGLQQHVKDLMERHQNMCDAMSAQQQSLAAAPTELKSQIAPELQEQQQAALASLREEMAGSMEAAIGMMRSDLEKTHGLAETMGDRTEAQQQQATAELVAQREDMASSMEAALGTLRQYMSTAQGVADTVGKRHEEQDEKNSKHINLLRGEMARAMGAALESLKTDMGRQQLLHPMAPLGRQFPLQAQSLRMPMMRAPPQVAVPIGAPQPALVYKHAQVLGPSRQRLSPGQSEPSRRSIVNGQALPNVNAAHPAAAAAAAAAQGRPFAVARGMPTTTTPTPATLAGHAAARPSHPTSIRTPSGSSGTAVRAPTQQGIAYAGGSMKAPLGVAMQHSQAPQPSGQSSPLRPKHPFAANVGAKPPQVSPYSPRSTAPLNAPSQPSQPGTPLMLAQRSTLQQFTGGVNRQTSLGMRPKASSPPPVAQGRSPLGQGLQFDWNLADRPPSLEGTMTGGTMSSGLGGSIKSTPGVLAPAAAAAQIRL